MYSSNSKPTIHVYIHVYYINPELRIEDHQLHLGKGATEEHRGSTGEQSDIAREQTRIPRK